jgi:hypothetical protein
MSDQLLHYLPIVALLAFAVWRRVSRSFGQQRIRRKSMIFRICLFSFATLMVSLSGFHKLSLLEGLIGGLLIGALVGFVGLRLTRFETDPVKGDCYVPNPWVGTLVTVLFLGRLAWRFIVLAPMFHQAATAAQSNDMSPFAGYTSSPLTVLIAGVLFGYYISYYAGLLVHHRRFQQAQLAGGTAV